MKQSFIFQTIVAIFALLVGYPLGGNIFIVLMVPFVLYMVVKKDAGFLPALMIHCASDTSIMYAVFFGMMIMCMINAPSLWRKANTRFYFGILLILFPLYGILTIQKGILDLYTWQASLGYTVYYLSFWAFLYGFLIADSFNRETVKLLLISFLVTFLLQRVLPSAHHYYRLTSMIVFLGVVYGLYYILYAKNIILGGLVSVVSLAIFFAMRLTFTELLSVIYAVVVFILWSLNKKRLAKKCFSWFPYLIIIILMIYGVNNMNTISIGNYSNQIEFSDWQQTWNRAQFKFYGDRAVFWDAAWNQLLDLKPILPMHNIPNLSVYKLSGTYLDDVSFGAHNTPLQLLRIYGIIMGGLLIICYIHCTVISAKIFALKKTDVFIIPLFTVVFANIILVFFGGTASMLPNYALFTFGLMGIAYRISNEQFIHETNHHEFR